MAYVWTKERTERLKDRWAAGDSATRIAMEFGMSRCAVLGKVFRLGLPKRRTTNQIPHTHRRRVERRGGLRLARVRAPKIAPEAPAPVPLAALNPVGFAALERHHCRFPFGDPLKPDFHYCGAPRAAEIDERGHVQYLGPYCPGHHRLAYTTRSALLADADARREADGGARMRRSWGRSG